MSFVNERHKANYTALMNLYGKRGEDLDYKAQIYIASYPELYECIDINNIDLSFGPLLSLMIWTGKTDNDENGELIIKDIGLTKTARSLAEAGMSLYNGFGISLDQVLISLSADAFGVFIQACSIRAGHNRT